MCHSNFNISLTKLGFFLCAGTLISRCPPIPCLQLSLLQCCEEVFLGSFLKKKISTSEMLKIMKISLYENMISQKMLFRSSWLCSKKGLGLTVNNVWKVAKRTCWNRLNWLNKQRWQSGLFQGHA